MNQTIKEKTLTQHSPSWYDGSRVKGYALTDGFEVLWLLEKTTHVNLLYDFYAPLLTEKQRSLMELYFHEDWSLGEIATHFRISRQAVFEGLKRAQEALEERESELHLLERHRKRLKIRDAIMAELDTLPENERIKAWVQELIDVD